MNFKKIAITAAAGSLMLASAVPAFAMPGMMGSSVKITTYANTSSNTGNNTINGGSSDPKGRGRDNNMNEIVTGNAVSASLVSNKTDTSSGSQTVTTGVTTSSNTGYNTVNGGMGSNVISSGNAGSVSAVSNVVNTKTTYY